MTPKGTKSGDRPSFGSSRDHGPERIVPLHATGPDRGQGQPAVGPRPHVRPAGLGVFIIFLNYIDVVPGGRSNWYLLGGLGLILGGIITATQYH